MESLSNSTRGPITSDSDSTTNISPARSFFRNRFSNASLLSLSSIRTFLPQYSVVDSLDDPAITPLDDTPPSSASTSSQNVIGPPRYSTLNRPNPSVMTWRASTVPLPDVEGDKHEFRYSYPIRAKKPWATLQLYTRDAVPGNLQPLPTQPRVPRFWSCDPIRGMLEVDLDSPQTIQQISILLTGSIVTSSHSDGALQFMGHEVTLWDKSMGDPRPGQSVAVSNSTQKKTPDGRFAPGQYVFPFSFPFPTQADLITTSATPGSSPISPFPPLAVGTVQHVTPSPTFSLREYIPKVAEKQKRLSQPSPSRFTTSSVAPKGAVPSASQMETSSRSPTSTELPRAHHGLASPLPQSFMETGIQSNVGYDMLVRIVHGRFKASSRIGAKIAYIPASHPHPASQKRREAYEAGALLPSPIDDPEGWLAWPTLNVYGVIDCGAKPRHTKAECAVYLAQPLSYTRGSVIPCFLTISSDDEELVHLLSNPKTPFLRLLRSIRHPIGQIDKLLEERSIHIAAWAGTGLSYPITTVPTGETKLVEHEVGRAQWWIPSKDIIQCPNVRHLEGEIHVSPNLHASCDLPCFHVMYAVELLPFRTDNFELESNPPSPGTSGNRDIVLASNPVEITTLHREDEPMPTAYSQPPKNYLVRQVNLDDKSVTIFE